MKRFASAGCSFSFWFGLACAPGLLGVLPSLSLAADPKIQSLPINSDADEDFPFFNQALNPKDPGRLYFSRKSASGKWDIHFARYEPKKRALGKDEILGPQVQTEMDDIAPCLTPEGRYPQFIVYSTKKDKFSPSTDIYVSVREGPFATREDRAFGPARPVAAIASKEDETDPWLHIAGAKTLHLYFTRKTKQGPRICLSVGESSQGSGALASLGPGTIIESIPPGYSHPTLVPDGKKMFLQGPIKGGTQGVFISYLSVGKWSPPAHVQQLSFDDARVGTVSPSLTRDGRTLYFATDKSGGKGGLDIYSVQVSELTLPK